MAAGPHSSPADQPFARPGFSPRLINAATFEQVWGGRHALKHRLQYNLEVARKDFLYVLKVLNLPRAHVTVLDVGFGNGMLLFTFAASCRLLGTELSPAAIHQAQVQARRRRYGDYLFVEPDDRILPFRLGACDLVIASHIVEHVADDLGLVREMLRVLKPGGHLILLLPLDASQAGQLSEAELINPAHLTAGHYHVRNYNLETLLHRLSSLPGEVVWTETDAQTWDWKCTLNPARQRLATASWLGYWLDRIIAVLINVPLALMPLTLLRALDRFWAGRGYRARQAIVVLRPLPNQEAEP
jgi:SAM-dependent methyltransferase